MAEEEEVAEPVAEDDNQVPNEGQPEANEPAGNTDSSTNAEDSVQLPPPMKQKLFLLEFIIDDISLDFCNAKQLICFGEGKTIIEFSFLDIGPLQITEDDFLPVQKHYLEGCTGNGSIKNGKSILFGLTPDEADRVKNRAVIYCDIMKKTEKKQYHLGTCMIRIINLFKDLLAMIEKGGRTYYYKNIKDCFKVKDINGGELVGHMYAYIRVSCFNEMIINKFKKDPNQQINYAVEEGFYHYKYNKSAPLKESNICDCAGNDKERCECAEESPAANCPEIYTDNTCAFDCPQTLRPCEACPETCRANKKAGKYHERSKPKNAKASKHSNKSELGKGAKKKNAKPKGKKKKK